MRIFTYNILLSLKILFSLLTPNFCLHNTYRIRHLVIRKWELVKQSKLLKIKSKILSNLFNEKYELKLGEYNNATETEKVKSDTGCGVVSSLCNNMAAHQIFLPSLILV